MVLKINNSSMNEITHDRKLEIFNSFPTWSGCLTSDIPDLTISEVSIFIEFGYTVRPTGEYSYIVMEAGDRVAEKVWNILCLDAKWYSRIMHGFVELDKMFNMSKADIVAVALNHLQGANVTFEEIRSEIAKILNVK